MPPLRTNTAIQTQQQQQEHREREEYRDVILQHWEQASHNQEHQKMRDMHVHNMDEELSSSSNSTPSLSSLSDSDSEKECGRIIRLCDIANQEELIDELLRMKRGSTRVEKKPTAFAATISSIFGADTKFSSEDNTLSILSPSVQVVISFVAILFWPLLLFNGEILRHSFGDFYRSIVSFYDGAFLSSSYLVGGCTMLVSLYYGHLLYERRKAKKWFCFDDTGEDEDEEDELEIASLGCGKTFFGLGRSAMDANLIIMAFFLIWNCFFAQTAYSMPSWVWYPFDLIPGRYNIYLPRDVSKPLDGLCLNYSFGESGDRDPLCLSENAWDALSGGVLSNKNDDDVAAVLKGVEYANQKSGGFAVNVMCRDCADKISTFRRNISNIRQFMPNLSLVVFENDSKDGSREMFKSWATEASDYGYAVHLLECENVEDCKYGEVHRYDDEETEDDWTLTSAVGKMANFRNRGIDYISNNLAFKDYSHVMVYDMDLEVSFSPLGILHSLGSMPDSPVAAHGMMPYPASFGSLNYPYDMAASRPIPTKKNYRLRQLHDLLCSLTAPGHRWRNLAESLSIFRMIMHLTDDRYIGDANNHESLYQVESSYNGAAIYPLERIRELNPRYDIGDDGQRCEHIGFNTGFDMPMYVNRKWNFNLKPSGGGPIGNRCMRSGNLVLFNPQLSFPLFAGVFLIMFPFVIAINRITMFLIYPMLRRMLFSFLSTNVLAALLPAGMFFSTHRPNKNKYLLPKTV